MGAAFFISLSCANCHREFFALLRLPRTANKYKFLNDDFFIYFSDVFFILFLLQGCFK